MKKISTHQAHVNAYLAVFGALMALTAATVTVSYLHLPTSLGILVGLAIATLKASLVAFFFMHLKGERILIYGLLGVTVFFMAVLFILPTTDSAWTAARRTPTDIAAQGHAAHAETETHAE